ncbi:MAG: B12-binding domain-containing radical SAM protein [Chloroflexi bacterium]|nr:B12-binding domain-containing radical SAM protein [Chloroflexota bacterium]
MRVMLIDPPGANKGLNTGLAYLAGALESGGHEASVLDLNNLTPGRLGGANPSVPAEVWRRELGQALDGFAPGLVGVSVKTFTSRVAAEIIATVQRMRPSVTLVVGGPHVTLDGARYVQETGASIGVIGEGEMSVPEICRAVERGESPDDIRGIVWRRGDEIVVNESRPALRDLDELPYPSYGVLSSVQRQPTMLHEYPLLTSRGCPFSCSYCSMPTLMGRRWRARSPANVFGELRKAVDETGASSFTIVDDNFTLDISRAEAICDALIAGGLAMPWSSQNGLRADRLTATLIEKMRRSGCYHVWIGIESGDEEVFKSIDKGEKLEHIKAGIRALQAAGIKVGGFFIIGLPGATRKSDLRSLGLAKELGIEAWWFNFVPYRYTRAWDWVQDHGTGLRSSEGTPQYGSVRMEPVFETPEYSRKERIATYQEVHVRLGYFERLVDPSATSSARVAYLLKVVPRYGPAAVLSLARYQVANLVHHIWRGLGLQGASSGGEVTETVENATSQNLAPSPIRPLEEQ